MKQGTFMGANNSLCGDHIKKKLEGYILCRDFGLKFPGNPVFSLFPALIISLLIVINGLDSFVNAAASYYWPLLFAMTMTLWVIIALFVLFPLWGLYYRRLIRKQYGEQTLIIASRIIKFNNSTDLDLDMIAQEHKEYVGK